MARAAPFTEEEIAFIDANRATMSGKDISRALGYQMNRVGQWMRHNNRPVSPELTRKFREDALARRNAEREANDTKDDEYLKANYLTMPIKAMGKVIKRQHAFIARRLKYLGLVIPDEIVMRNRQTAQFKPGFVPANKGKPMTPEMYAKAAPTMFKKGDLPLNSYADRDGIIAVRGNYKRKSFYKWIKLDHGKWELYQRYLWKQANGPIPDKHQIIFIDGDPMNCVLSNLKMISFAESATQNRWGQSTYTEEEKRMQNVVKALKSKIRQNERESKRTK